MRRALKGTGLVLALALLALGGMLAGLNTDPGRRLAEHAVGRLSGGTVTLAGLAGRFPGRLRLARLELRDAAGVWLEIDGAALNWAPAALLRGQAHILSLSAQRIALARLPRGESSSSGGGGLPVGVALDALEVARIELAAPVLGQAVALAARGQARLDPALDGAGRLDLIRLDAPGTATLEARREGGTLHAALAADGPLADLAGLPGLPALHLTAAADGPASALTLRLDLAAGDAKAQVDGSLDLPGRAAELAVSASTPALRLRPDLGWQALAVQGHLTGPLAAPEAALSLTLEGLEAQGARLARLEARAMAHGGAATLDASAAGLDLPGAPAALAATPLILHAEADLAAPDRPVRFTLAHRLATLAGTVRGRKDSAGRLALDADLTGTPANATPPLGPPISPLMGQIHLEGLPDAPSGRITAGGSLDGAPLDLALTLARTQDGALHAGIDALSWRSLHGEGRLDLPAGATLPQGEARLAFDRLDDLSRLLGVRLAGSLTLRATSAPDPTGLTLSAEARGVVAPGAALREARLTATLRSPETDPRLQAELDLAGRAGGIAGTARLEAAGPPGAIELRAQAALTGVGGVGGAPLAAQARATLDASARRLALTAAQADWQGQSLRLLAPARLDFAGGLALDRLRLGLGGATLDLSGPLAPKLEARASLRNLDAGLARIFAPDLALQGRIEGDAQLSGTLAAPEGTLHLAASGVRAESGPAAGLPPASLDASARLAGTTAQGTLARVQARLAAGPNLLTLDGTAPLSARGALALVAGGHLDLASLDPLLAAAGRRVRGTLRLDAHLTGTQAAPRLIGTLSLAGGEVQDFALGLRLDDINGEIAADGTTLRLLRLDARADPGRLSATGSLDLGGAMPIDLTLTAERAHPLASDALSATLNGSVALRGALRTGMRLSGQIQVPRADIRVPEKLPAKVAVLKLRRSGVPQPPPAAAVLPEVALDLTVVSPGQIFVRGRGLDAELAGRLRLGGTLAAPQPAGGFTLRRGQFSLAGTTLDFTRGRVGFDGSGRIDPSLDFLASSTSGTTTANLAITGTASAPQITLSATPEMPQDEVLAWLLFHQSSASLSPLQLAQIAQALAQISGVGGGFDPLETLRSGLGLDRLSVGNNASGKGSAVEAGSYVARGVYLGARQSTSGGGPQAVMQIDLARGLKLEATGGQSTGATGDEGSTGGASVGVTYQFEY